MGANWTGEPIPERPGEMRLIDWALIVACAVIVVVIGVVAAGGPN